MTAPQVDVSSNTVAHGGVTYSVQPLGEDSYTVLNAGVPVGRIVYSFGAANGIVEGDISQESLDAIAEAWFNVVGG